MTGNLQSAETVCSRRWGAVSVPTSNGRWYVSDKSLKERQPHHHQGALFFKGKEASTGLGHINLWYGENHPELSTNIAT
ncbi:hypothetical protein J6590_011909 [Homalodisca vitripennis]|nr:hypothetical protein J6590_011909 [Homalodisca vitripennis]